MSSSSENNTTEVHQNLDPTPKIILDAIDQQHDRWLDLRRGKISGSNVATVCGLNPYKSSLQLWAEWTGKVSDTFTGNRSTQLGLTMEPLVAQWFSERVGVPVRRANALYQDTELDWLVASPDYLLPNGDPLEIKTGNHRTAHRWAEGSAPVEYVLQLQVQMRVLRRQHGVLTAYLGDVENLPDVGVDYDPELWSMVQEKAEAFLDCVKTDTPPLAGAGDAEVLRVITNRNEGEVREWVNDDADKVAYLLAMIKDAAMKSSELRKQLEAAEKEKKELENRIKQFLGTATMGQMPDGRVVKLTTVHVGEKVVGAYSYDRLSLPK